jgi:multiple sugar transport system ATP-binding protein
MSSIELRNVGKRYGALSVLDNISLKMEEGEFVVLVGPSGCGKSTLLRMISGLEDISDGEITMDGRVVNDIPAKKRDLAMVFQSYALYPHMNVAANMGFALRLQGVPKKEIRQKVDDVGAILGLESLMDRLPRDLSGGQRQRVAMGRAIVRDPRVFLFDEPLSNLDAKLRTRMRGEIKKMHQRLGRTTVYVTHDQTEAMTMADKIVVLNGGRIEQMGPPLELYENFDNLFVAGFIGSPEINVLQGMLEDEYFRSKDGTLYPLPSGKVSHASRDVTYAIRPEHIRVDTSGIPGEVLVVEPTGDGQTLLVRVGDNELTVVIRNSAALKPGARVGLGIDSAKILLFDSESGGRIR